MKSVLMFVLLPVVSGWFPEPDRDKSGTSHVSNVTEMQKPRKNPGFLSFPVGGAERGGNYLCLLLSGFPYGLYVHNHLSGQ